MDQPASDAIPGYRILRPLGRGGMAAVYLAIQESLGREVALKLLSPSLASDESAAARFLREGQISARLSHRHIVGVHDVGVHAGQPYLSMEYMAGGTLDASTALPPRRALAIVREIALALDFAHRAGVVHRDVKPGNILIRADGSHALSDFGIARAADQAGGLTAENATIGTPHYMSPEQLQAKAIDGRSDLYSLGVVLFQLLTGRLPFEGSDGWSIGMQHLQAPVPALPDELARWQGLVNVLMAKDPAERPQTGAAVAARIEASLMADSAGAVTTEIKAAAPAGTPVQKPRLRRWVLAFAALLLVALLATAAAWWLPRPVPPQSLAVSAGEWVLVADVAVHGGPADLVASLDQAFRQGLAQSRHVNVISGAQVREALAGMGLDPASTPIDRDLAIRLAGKLRAGLVLLPEARSTGPDLRLGVTAFDPELEGVQPVALSEPATADALLPALDRLLSRLRRELGESELEIGEDSIPLAQVTTSDLEALRLYSLGRRLYEQLKYDDARRMYERALAIDPDFAMAHIGLATIASNLARDSEALQHSREAAARKDRLSRREALYIDAQLASSEDPERGIELWRDYAAIYPDSGTGQNNAGVSLWTDFNRCAEALPLLHEAFASRGPLSHLSGHFKAHCQLWMGDGAGAAATFEAAIAKGGLPLTFGIVDAYAFLERPADAERVLALDSATMPPLYALERAQRRITWLAWQGRLREALAAAEAARESALAANLGAQVTRSRIHRMALELHLGRTSSDLGRLLAEVQQVPATQPPRAADPRLTLAALALIAQRQGQQALAGEALAALAANPPGRLNLPVEALQAATAYWRWQPGAAQLSPDQRLESFVQVRVARAAMLERTGDLPAAAREWQAIDDFRGRAFAEYNDYFTLQVLNVLDANLALAARVRLAADPAERNAMRRRLAERLAQGDPGYREWLGYTDDPSSDFMSLELDRRDEGSGPHRMGNR